MRHAEMVYLTIRSTVFVDFLCSVIFERIFNAGVLIACSEIVRSYQLS